MAIILGVDRLLDMSRTAVNVTGDLVASLLLDAPRVDEPGREFEGTTPAS